MKTNFDVEQMLNNEIRNFSDKINEIENKIEESSRKAVLCLILEQAMADAELGYATIYQEERVNLQIELQRLSGEKIEARQIYEALLTIATKIQTPEKRKWLEDYFKKIDDLLAV
jgi:hypothetical protein